MKKILIEPSVNLKNALKQMSASGEKCLVVVDKKNKLLGTPFECFGPSYTTSHTVLGCLRDLTRFSVTWATATLPAVDSTAASK